MYKIDVDVAKHRVLIEFSGTYDDDLAEFGRQMVAACIRAKGIGRHFDMLSDFSQAPIMTQQTAGDSQEHVKWCIDNGLRKGANVVGGALSRMQLNRITADEKFQMFETRAQAEAWLDI
jgi:hypothetical protein